MHRHSEYTEDEWRQAFEMIMDSGLSQFYKNYYSQLYKRILNGEVLVWENLNQNNQNQNKNLTTPLYHKGATYSL